MKSVMRSITVIIILLLLVSCAPTEARVQEAIMQTQAAQPTATGTPEPTATATPEPTNTPTIVTYAAEKTEIANSIRLLTNQKDTNVFCESVTWEGDLLKLKCKLVDFFIEPSDDHNHLHYWIINAVRESLQDDEWERYFSKASIIEIITVGRVMQELSKTNFSTFEKIMDGSITTKIEWLSEAKVSLN
jgi:hypothetical protein